MKGRLKILAFPSLALGVVVIGSLLGWMIGGGRFDGTRADLQTRIDTYVKVMREVLDQRQRRPALDGRLAAVLDRSLGADLEYVDSRMRRVLAELTAAAGLRDAKVSTSGAMVVGTPAKREFSRSRSSRPYRDEPDFVVLPATVSGRGSIGEVIAFLHGLDAASWIKRIESVRLDPDPDGKRLTVGVRLATLFVPDWETDEESVPAEVRPRRELARYDPLVAANPFRVRRAPTRPKPPATPAPRPVAVDPLEGWMLTGLVEGDPGNEGWIRHRPSGRTATLIPGRPTDLGRGLQVELLEISGDRATIRVGEETWTVLVGRGLGDRVPGSAVPPE